MRGQRPKERWEINQGFRNQHQATMMPQLGEEVWVEIIFAEKGLRLHKCFMSIIRMMISVLQIYLWRWHTWHVWCYLSKVWTTQWASVPSSILCEDGFSLPTRPFQNSSFRRTTRPLFECVLYPIFALNPHWSLAQYGAMSICKRLPASLRKLYLNWKDRGRWCCRVCLLN